MTTTYEVHNDDTETAVASGLETWPQAVRLADSYTKRTLTLHWVKPSVTAGR